MADEMTFEITSVESNIKEVMKAVNEKMHLAIGLMAEEVEKNAKKDCPVDTGLLRNSLTYAYAGFLPVDISYSDDANEQHGSYTTATPSAADPEADDEHVAYVGTNVEYAPYVEFGSYHHEVGKSHFLRDAGQNHIPRLQSIAATTLKKLD